MKPMIEEVDFRQYMLSTYSISERELDHIIEDINSYYDLEVKEFVRMKHFGLKNSGLNNETIYQTVPTPTTNSVGRFKHLRIL